MSPFAKGIADADRTPNSVIISTFLGLFHRPTLSNNKVIIICVVCMCYSTGYSFIVRLCKTPVCKINYKQHKSNKLAMIRS